MRRAWLFIDKGRMFRGPVMMMMTTLNPDGGVFVRMIPVNFGSTHLLCWISLFTNPLLVVVQTVEPHWLPGPLIRTELTLCRNLSQLDEMK